MRERACVRACMYVHACAHACVRVCTRMHAYFFLVCAQCDKRRLGQVYIAQLHRRAVILDGSFKDKVMEAINLDGSESDCDSVGRPSTHATVDTLTAASRDSTDAHRSLPTSRSGTSLASDDDHDSGLMMTSINSRSQASRRVSFTREGRVTHAEVFFAKVKKQVRMREKLAKYAPPYPHSQWPLTAHITDPVRLSVVCSGPSDVMQVSSGPTQLQ